MRTNLDVFVDFLCAVGLARLGIARGIGDSARSTARSFDFYAPLREALRARPGDFAGLDALLSAQTDLRKGRIYPSLVGGLQRWVGSLSPAPKWAQPPQATWLASTEVAVEVAPELAYRCAGELHVVCCSFEAIPLSERRALTTIAIMREALRDRVEAGTVFGVLDVKEGLLRVWAPADAVPWADILAVALADAHSLVKLSGPLAA
jgi:hypothetical protein